MIGYGNSPWGASWGDLATGVMLGAVSITALIVLAAINALPQISITSNAIFPSVVVGLSTVKPKFNLGISTVSELIVLTSVVNGELI